MADAAFIKHINGISFLTNLFQISPDELYPSFPHGKQLSFLFKNLSYYLKKTTVVIYLKSNSPSPFPTWLLSLVNGARKTKARLFVPTVLCTHTFQVI
jgi:hypothetical protein